MSHVTVLAGGGGGAKFLVGLMDAVPEEDIHVIVNVGDDTEVWGLHVSPDIDNILYALAGELDFRLDWGRPDETYNCQHTLRKLGMRGGWIEDHDLATHLIRSNLLKDGASLEDVTTELTDRFGIGARIMPATNDPLRTRIHGSNGACALEEWLRQSNHINDVVSVTYDGAETASAPESVVQSILGASRIVVAPSDPVVSIGAILAVPGIRDALLGTEAGVVAVSPVVGSQAVDGDLADLMKVTGSDAVSVRDIAVRYRDFLDALVIHTADVAALDSIRETGVEVWVENILIHHPDEASRLAQRIVNPTRTLGGTRKG